MRITQAETVAAITRRERGGTITPADAATALADSRVDFAHQCRIVEVSAGLVAQAALTPPSTDAELDAAALAEGLAVE